MFVFQTVLEFLVAGFIIFGVFNEEKLVRFEDRLFAAVKRKFKAKKRNVYRHKADGDRFCA